MESSILRELAAFDVTAPIFFTISFEDSNDSKESSDEIVVKTENVADDDNANSQVTTRLSNTITELRNEIKEEPIELYETTDVQPKIETEAEKIELQESVNKENSNKEKQNNILNDINCLQTEISQSSVTVGDDSRKRKQKRLQIYKKKKAKETANQEKLSNHSSSHIDETETHNSYVSNTNSTHQNADIQNASHLNPPPMASTASIPTTNENERKIIASFIIRCLAGLSQNMRHIMEAYLYHKQYNTPYESFLQQKNNYFKASYSTVVKILLPERQNQEFMRYFLNKTYQDIWQTSPHNKSSIQDYATLLIELLNWATEHEKRIAQAARKKENIMQPSVRHCDTEEKICIYSSESGGTGVTIAVDPKLKQYLAKSANYNNNKASRIQTPNEPSRSLEQSQVHLPSQLATRASNQNKHLTELLQQPILKLPLASCLPNIPRTDFQSRLHPEIYKGVKGNLPNNDILTKPMNTRSPQVQKSFEMQNEYMMPGQSRHLLPQSKQSQQILPECQQPPRVLPAYGQAMLAASPFGQSTRTLPPPYGQSSQPMPPWLHVQSQIGNSQNVQSKPRQQFGQLQHNTLPPYGQIQRQIGQSQNVQPQYGQYQMRHEQPIQQQQVLQHVSPLIGQSQSIPQEHEQTLQTEEWRQGLNELYTHKPQTHKSAPRSASTDSGFISPLHFNSSSSDQTVPPIPSETDSSTLLITHVTSLNPKVSFMDEGSCVVCKKTTKKVCMGCMKIYYCTYECQLQDWQTHGPDCNNIRIMAQLANQNNSA